MTGDTRLSFIVIACLSLAVRTYGQVTTLPQAIHAAETANRTIQVAALEHEKALRNAKAVKTQRFPVFSVIALGSQPLNQLGITLERGSLGVSPSDDGPRFVYYPAATLKDASRSALKQLVRTFFGDSPGSAAAALLDMTDAPLSDEEYRRLSALLKRRRDGGQR